MKPIIRFDKLNRICGIMDAHTDSIQTPEVFKPTLNMFVGRQLTRFTIRECLNYLRTSLEAQTGNVAAQKKLDSIHRSWNE